MAGTPDNDKLTDVARIRLVLARELETINEYEAYAAAASHPEVRAFFLHLAAEEKEHVAEATHMLRMLDAGQDAHFQEPPAPDHFQKAVTPRAPQPSEPAPSVSPTQNGRRTLSEPLSPLAPERVVYGVPAPPTTGAAPLTVGSLRRTGGNPGQGGRR